MARKSLVGKPVLADKLKPELGAELVERIAKRASEESRPKEEADRPKKKATKQAKRSK